MSSDLAPKTDTLTPWGRAVCDRAIRAAGTLRRQFPRVISRHLRAQARKGSGSTAAL